MGLHPVREPRKLVQRLLSRQGAAHAHPSGGPEQVSSLSLAQLPPRARKGSRLLNVPEDCSGSQATRETSHQSGGPNSSHQARYTGLCTEVYPANPYGSSGDIWPLALCRAGQHQGPRGRWAEWDELSGPRVHPAMRGVGVQGQAWPGGGTVTGPPSSCAQGSWGLSQKPGSSVLDLMAKRKAWAKHSSNRIYSHIFTECQALC